MVNLAWYVRGWINYSRERILPMGDVVLLFNLDGEQGLVDRKDPDQVQPFTESWISGLQQSFVTVESSKTHMLGMRMTPWGVHRLFGLPMTEVVDQVVMLDDVFGAGMAHLLERLRNANGVIERLAVLEENLLGRLDSGSAPAAEALYTLRTLLRSNGQASMGEISRYLGVTPKRIANRFAACVGVTPKRYARLLRYQNALSQLSESTQDLGELALDCGYYDQAHFNREFKAFTGSSPSEYLRLRGPDGTSIVEEIR